jgi:hypothetical protein
MVAGMSTRERRLAAAMGVLAVGFAIFLVVFFVRSAISDLESESDELDDLLAQIAKQRDEYKARKLDQSREKTRGRSKPTPLRTLVDRIAEQVEVTVPDIKEHPDQRHGETWVEHAAELSIREVGLESLTKFMEEVEGNGRKFPIAITKLEVRKRKRTEDSFDVKMTISTYEKVEKEPAAGKRAGAGGSRQGGR